MTKTAGLLAALLLAAFARAAAALDLGDQAPEIEPTEWAQGAPMKLADGAGKTVVVLLFWRTFDLDCVDPMNELSSFYEKNKGKGLDVVAVTTEVIDDVKTFLAEHKVAYRVAIDRDHNTEALYVKDVRKMPYAVVVDREGVVVWKGDPSWGMNEVLQQVVDGKYDLKRAQEIDRLQSEMWEAMWNQEQDVEKLAKAADALLAVDPANTSGYDGRVQAFQRKNDLAGFKKWVRAHVEKLKNEPKTLSYVAGGLVDDRGEWSDPELAVEAARRAVEASKGADADVLDVNARVLHEVGLLDQAIDVEKKALALATDNTRIKGRLAYLQACAAARAAAKK